jgi:hypothetical protein
MANHLVYRRYCAVEDVLAIAILPKQHGDILIFDTGGDLIELGELAKIVVEYVNPSAEIRRQVDPGLPSDDYHSDGKEWDDLVQFAGIGFDSLSNQIARVANRS